MAPLHLNRAWRFVGVAAVGGLFALAVQAQIMSSPTAAQRCLTPAVEARGTPIYPEAELLLRRGGRVSVEMEFTTPDKRPKVLLLEATGGDDFVDAVKDHVANFRVPCLEYADIPVRLRQEFVFVPNDGRKVTWTNPRDADSGRVEGRLACLRHMDGETAPQYPRVAQAFGRQGTVLLRLRFVGPDEAPKVTELYDGGYAALGAAVREFVQGYRLPCLHEGSIEASQAFEFEMRGGVKRVLRDVSLQALLRQVKGIQEKHAYFDFTGMSCPFDVRLGLYQPFTLNAVGEIGAAEPARRPFLDWLAGLELDSPMKVLSTVYGTKMTVSVPCGKLDL